MYKKKPIHKKIYKKIIYALTKIFVRPLDKFFNTTLEAKIKIKLLKLHSQNYKFLEKKIYFIHVPKCGGTTMHNILQKIYKNKLFNYNHPYKYDENTHYPLKKKTIFRNSTYITILRDPCLRVWSYYNDCMQDLKNPYRAVATKGLENFCKKVWEVQNMYTKYFSGNLGISVKSDVKKAISNLKKFNYILVFENLNHDIKFFLKKFKIKKKIQIRNKKRYKLPTKDQIKIIAKYNKLDSQIYKKILIIKKI